jgi:hypothetical protein
MLPMGFVHEAREVRPMFAKRLRSALAGGIGALTVVTAVFAADDDHSFGPLYHPYSIERALGEKPVQEDLNMSASQIKAAKAVIDRVKAKHGGDATKAYNAPKGEGKKIVDDGIAQQVRETLDALPTVLRPDQIKRLRQILNQELGSGLLSRPEIRSVMKISDEQMQQLKEIQDSLRKQLIENVQAGKIPRKDASRYDQLLIKLIQPEVKQALSPEQRAMLKDLLGVRLVR